MNKFTVENLNLHYGDFHALKNVSLNIPANEITAFIGPSGCGKKVVGGSFSYIEKIVKVSSVVREKYIAFAEEGQST